MGSQFQHTFWGKYMLKFAKILAASTVLACAGMPVQAQEAEEPRTTYRVTLIDLADDADERWLELYDTMIAPARAAAGLSPETIHWVMMNPDYDLMVVMEMPRGLSAFDTHANPEREAFVAQLTQIAGGEEQLETMGEEWDTLTKSEVTFYTHTHP